MRILLNGQQREIPDGLTISGLIAHLELAGERIAVERNGEIVRRAEWDGTRLQEGDRLEIVHFVGGGYDGGCATATLILSTRWPEGGSGEANVTG